MTSKYLTVEKFPIKRISSLFSRISIHPDLQYRGTLCWIWFGCRDRKGYGHITLRGQQPDTVGAHRVMYAWLIAPLPVGKTGGEVDHLCKRTSCCNPVHLELVPSEINVERSDFPPALNKRKTHCRRGHPLTGDNLRNLPNGRRGCKTCQNAAADKWRQRNIDKVRRKSAERERKARKQEGFKAKRNAYYAANKEKIQAQRKLRKTQ